MKISQLQEEAQTKLNQSEFHDQEIRSLQNQIVELRAQLGEKDTKITENEHQGRENDVRIAELEGQLKVELERQKSHQDAMNQHTLDLDQLSALQAQIDELLKQQQLDKAEIDRLNLLLRERGSAIDQLTSKNQQQAQELEKHANEIIRLYTETAQQQEQIKKQNEEIARLIAENDKIKPLQQMNVRLKKEAADQKAANEKLAQELATSVENLEKLQTTVDSDKEAYDKLKVESDAAKLAVDKLKKENAELKKQLQDHKKKNPDGSCGCSCCDHEQHKDDKHPGDVKKLQEELDSMKSKYNSLKEETSYQREAHKKELKEANAISKDQQNENDR